MEDCCQKKENRNEPEQLRPDVSVEKCKVCGRRHFVMVADPGYFKLRLEE